MNKGFVIKSKLKTLQHCSDVYSYDRIISSTRSKIWSSQGCPENSTDE